GSCYINKTVSEVILWTQKTGDVNLATIIISNVMPRYVLSDHLLKPTTRSHTLRCCIWSSMYYHHYWLGWQ
ncbi:uncharacterized protein A4U43_C03F6860, partial [Asparagus officinalis]